MQGVIDYEKVDCGISTTGKLCGRCYIGNSQICISVYGLCFVLVLLNRCALHLTLQHNLEFCLDGVIFLCISDCHQIHRFKNQ